MNHFFKNFSSIKKFEAGGFIELTNEIEYPKFYLPSSYFIPEQVKNLINNIKIPKKKYSLPFDYSLEEAKKITKNFRKNKEESLSFNTLFYLGDILSCTDGHLIVFIAIKQKKYGFDILFDNYDYNDLKKHAFFKVKNKDHEFFEQLTYRYNNFRYIFKSQKYELDLQKLYYYLEFFLNNNIIKLSFYTIPLYYEIEEKEEVIYADAKYLKYICDLYFSFGINKVYVYILYDENSVGGRFIMFSYLNIDVKIDIIEQLKNNIFVLLMPVTFLDKKDKIINYLKNLLKYNITTNQIKNYINKKDQLFYTNSLLNKNDFQFDHKTFKSNINTSTRLYGKYITDRLLKILNNFAFEKNLNKKYSEMTEKELKLAYSILWIKLWLEDFPI